MGTSSWRLSVESLHSLSAESNMLSDLPEDRCSQFPRPASPLLQHSLQMSPVRPQPLDLLSNGRQPLDHSLSYELLIGSCIQASGLVQRFLHGDHRHGSMDRQQVGHTRARLWVKGDFRDEVCDSAADLKGDVIRRVCDGDRRHALGVGFGHFGGGVTEGFDLSRGACGRKTHWSIVSK